MGTTTNGLPYPEGTDPVTDGATAIEDLATAVDDLVAGAAPTAGGAVTPGANVGMIAGTPAIRRGRMVLLVFNGWATTGALSPGDTLGTIASGYGPTTQWRGVIFNHVDGVAFHITIETTGVVKTEVAIGGSGKTLYGSVAYPI